MGKTLTKKSIKPARPKKIIEKQKCTANRYKKAYDIVFATKPEWLQREILDKESNRIVDAFIQQVVALAESNSSL